MTCYRCIDINCGRCWRPCLTQVIHEHPDRQFVFKCDLCEDEPQGIASCQHLHVLAIDPVIDKALRAREAEVPLRAALAGS